MSYQNIKELIKTHEVKFIDLRFTDLRGKEQHLTIPASQMSENLLTDGKMFDGSSLAGWKSVHDSDMVLKPDPTTAVLDPFLDEMTLLLRCDIYDPASTQSYSRDPRSVAKRAEHYLKSTGIADFCFFGPEPEFFIFDDVKWKTDIHKTYYSIDSEEAAWNSDSDIGGGNLGHRPSIKGGYFPVPPVDSSQDIRSSMCLTLEKMGLIVEAHHHEVAMCNQNEIGTRFNTLVHKADELQILKYVIHNVAHAYGKTATFMPKPLVGDNGSGMHCHLSLAKGPNNLFAGDSYAGLSETALFFIGGILKHAKTLNAFTNSTTNSYKRLVPGFEAPVLLTYSAKNRSAAIRIPFSPTPNARRIEIRFPDGATNPYLAFAALLMAGLDGIRNQIHPKDPMDKDLYDLPKEETAHLDIVAQTLQEALTALNHNRTFLKEGGVFNDEIIEAYMTLKQSEITRLAISTHPIEFELYYSL